MPVTSKQWLTRGDGSAAVLLDLRVFPAQGVLEVVMKQYARVLLDKALENKSVSADCLANHHCNAAANRLYYACYQAMLGCLHHFTGFRAPSTNEHATVMAEFDKQFVQSTQLIDQTTFRKIAELKNRRLQADYKPTHVSAEELWPLAKILTPAILLMIRHAESKAEPT